MKILKELSRKEFRSKFGSEELCFLFLSEVKWSKGFACFKCKNKKYSKGKTPYNKRCTRCGYDESPTANTLFHKVKFGIEELGNSIWRVFYRNVFLGYFNENELRNKESSTRLETNLV